MSTQVLDAAGSLTELDRWTAFRASREDGLRQPHDWLSVSGFLWVSEEPAQLAPVPGTWWVSGDAVHVRASAADGLEILAADGTATVLDGETSLSLGEAVGQRLARFGDDVLVEALLRGGYYALRLRDPQAPARTSFDGVPTFDYDPSWRIPVRFEPYEAVRKVTVNAAAPGLTQVAATVGEIVFERDGVEHRLVATSRGEGWAASFSDETSGVETSAWRSVPIEGDATSGEGIVDFNYATNYPYAFSDFGTCPAPVKANQLALAVRAGELAPAGRTGVPPTSGGPTALPGPQR